MNYSIYELLKVNCYRLSQGRFYPAITISRRYLKTTKHFHIKDDGIVDVLVEALDYYFKVVKENSEPEAHSQLKLLAKTETVEAFFSDNLAATLNRKIDTHNISFCSDFTRNGKPKFISQSRPNQYQNYNAIALNIPNGARMTKFIHNVNEYIKTIAIYSATIFYEQYDQKIIDSVLLTHYWFMKSEWFNNFKNSGMFSDDKCDRDLANCDVDIFRKIVESALEQLKKQVSFNDLFSM